MVIQSTAVAVRLVATTCHVHGRCLSASDYQGLPGMQARPPRRRAAAGAISDQPLLLSCLAVLHLCMSLAEFKYSVIHQKSSEALQHCI